MESLLKRHTRAWLAPAAVFLASASLTSIVVWQLHQHGLREERARAAELVSDHAYALQRSIERSLSATYALAALVRQGQGEVPAFEAVAGEMLPFYPGVCELALSPGGVVTRVAPLAGNERALGLNQLQDPVQSPEAFLARDSGKLTLAGPLQLVQGGVGAIGRLPVFLDDHTGRPAFWGFTNVVIRFPDILDAAGLPQLLSRGLRYELTRLHPEDRSRLVIARLSPTPLENPVTRSIELPNGTWTLAAAPVAGWGATVGLALPATLAVFFSLLLALMTRLLIELQQHRRNLEQLVAARTAEVRSREADLHRAQSVARLGSWVLDLSRYHAKQPGAWRWSAELSRVYGFDPNQPHLLTQFFRRVHPEERALVAAAWRDLLQGQPRDFDFRICLDHRIRWLRVRAESEVIEGAAGQRLVGTVQDITERKTSEEALRESERRFRLILETISLLGVLLDREGRILLCNDYLLELTGWRREEVLQQDWFSLFLPPENRDEVRRSVFLSSMSRGEVIARFENQIVTRLGERRLVSWNNTLIRDEAGTVIGIAGIGEDITARRSLEEQLRQAQKMEVVGRLAGGIAHDFNNILTAMSLNLELLQTARPAEVPAFAEELKGMTTRATRLTQQLLMFARRQALQVGPLELNTAIVHLASLLRRLLGETITLQVSTHPLPLWIEADGSLIDQAVMNLCLNARDAMPGGGTLSLATAHVAWEAGSTPPHPDARPGNFACLTVTDTGTGMPPEVLQHLFEPFFTTKEVGKGTGLGLASVHGMVHQHRGWIEVASTVGRGSTFRLYFPLRGREGASPRAPSASTSPRGAETVLLVEDEDIVRMVTTSLLRSLGYRVLSAPQAEAALRLWDHHQREIDVLLTDMIMPGGRDGLQLGALLRQSKPDLPIVLMSGYNTQMSIRLPAGVTFLAKPFDSAGLASAIRAALDRPASANADQPPPAPLS
ncbi:MAG: PAS domain S-box protein [Verrucomicrobia bacterium]|nr:PAS domain S-box protein [Verrucomicrobiota bacterium]